jgi:hypothetical protein
MGRRLRLAPKEAMPWQSGSKDVEQSRVASDGPLNRTPRT